MSDNFRPASSSSRPVAAGYFLRKTNQIEDRVLRHEYTAFALALGKKIQCLREKSGLTRAQMEARYGGQWEHLESGGDMSVKELFSVAKIFGMSVRNLLEKTERHPKR